MIDKKHKLPITDKCRTLELSLKDKDRELMRLIDEINLGSRKIKKRL